MHEIDLYLDSHREGKKNKQQKNQQTTKKPTKKQTQQFYPLNVHLILVNHYPMNLRRSAIL